MAEDIDSQLKRMAEDLKEIIEQINTANSNQDQDQSTVRGVVMEGCGPIDVLCLVFPDSADSECPHRVLGLD